MKLKYSELKRMNSNYIERVERIDGGNSMKMQRTSSAGASGSLASKYRLNEKEKEALIEAKNEAEEQLKVATAEINQVNEGLDYEVNWDNLTWQDKAKLFRYWSIFTFFGNVIQIFAALFFVLRQQFGLHISEYMCGFGCMFAWFGLVQYLDYSPKYSFILKTLTQAVPMFLRTALGILPIYIAVVLLAVCLFSASTRFQSSSWAAMNLYSMIQGDELQDVFRDLTSIQLLEGLLFLYLWVFFGMA